MILRTACRSNGCGCDSRRNASTVTRLAGSRSKTRSADRASSCAGVAACAITNGLSRRKNSSALNVGTGTPIDGVSPAQTVVSLNGEGVHLHYSFRRAFEKDQHHAVDRHVADVWITNRGGPVMEDDDHWFNLHQRPIYEATPPLEGRTGYAEPERRFANRQTVDVLHAFQRYHGSWTS